MALSAEGQATTLADLRAGETLTVEEVRGPEEFRRRLYQLGFLPGVSVRLARRLPFGGPIEVALRGVRFGLRVRDAELVAGRR